MTSEAEALAAVLARVPVLPAEKQSLLDSLGRFSAAELWAQRPLPAFDNSAMDGYAVQAASAKAGSRLRVVGAQPAGADLRLTIGAGEALRIFTGAPLPAGADAVVMQEDVVRSGDTIAIEEGVEPGEFVRRKGSDLAMGQKILARGDLIAAQNIGLLASQGLAEIAVGSLPRVAIVSTGDELARLGETPRPGQIFESNALMLEALVRSAGAVVATVEHAPDALDALTATLRRGLEGDVLIVSGGVSVGERDFVRTSLGDLGAEIDLWRIALKPGKPFLFGRRGGCAIFGLPGNPVSAFVTFLKFVRPALRRMMGASEEHQRLRRVAARLGAAVKNTGDRPHYLRGNLHDGLFSLTGRQESHALFGLSQANALLRLAPNEHFAEGAEVTVELWV